MSFAAGIGVGIAVGISAGITTGRSGALSALEKAFKETGVTIHDPDGNELDSGVFLKEAIQIGNRLNRPKLIALLVLGIGVLIFGVIVFWLRAGI